MNDENGARDEVRYAVVGLGCISQDAEIPDSTYIK
jgi:hypothetical protein